MWYWLKNIIFAKKDSLALLALALFQKRTPKHVRLLLLFAIFYLISPIDLIPDTFIGSGLLDDLVVVPTIVSIAEHLIPPDVRYDLEAKSRKLQKFMPWIMGAIITLIIAWLVLIIYAFYKLLTM